MDQFEAYFRRADLDRDGKISGAEAVAFLQGSNLPRQVLAQIWMNADQTHSGYLSKGEFFNALKLVTVAQRKRELTPDIVRAALHGPASSQIPAPAISFPANQTSSATSSEPLHRVTAGTIQNTALISPGAPNTSISIPVQQTQPVRPDQRYHTLQPAESFGNQGIPHLAAQSHLLSPVVSSFASSSANSFPRGSTSANSIYGSNVIVSTPRATNPSTPVTLSHLSNVSSLSPKPAVNSLSQNHVPAGMSANDSIFSRGVSANDSFFSGGLSTVNSLPNQRLHTPVHSLPSTHVSSITTPVLSGVAQLPPKPQAFNSLQNSSTNKPLGNEHHAKSLPVMWQNSNQHIPATSSAHISPLEGVGSSNGNYGRYQPPLPKMKASDIQKYAKVFYAVDTDQDGKITGEQARNLFLSWKLSRDVLKRVWDLSDQDNDGMLSLREFCVALYLMEWHRGGHPLPLTLPNAILFDETLTSLPSQPKVGFGNSDSSTNLGYGGHFGGGTNSINAVPNLVQTGVTSVTKSEGVVAHTEHETRQSHQRHSSLIQNSTASALAYAPKNKDEETATIMDSKEKLEFYRNKMQELVLYKSRCDSRLNEITERALAENREAELLAKKYEEKYKQVAEMASKMTIEEAALRDIQARKAELQQAIHNVEHGGSADGLLQVRADRIQAELDELMKTLAERCKGHGIELKVSSAVQLPLGWQPGIQEGAALWDEDWDKFDDEGFTSEIVVGENKAMQSTELLQPDTPKDGTFSSGTFSSHDEIMAASENTQENTIPSEPLYTHNEEDGAGSPQSSVAGSSLESQSHEFSNVFVKSFDTDAEDHRSFDEPIWSSFDAHHMDSAWGFDHTDTKDAFGKTNPAFEELMPGTPSSKTGSSPRYSDHADVFSRFDSFNINDSAGFSPRQPQVFTRFDSMSSTKEFTSFDEPDPFGSTGPFKVSSSDQSPKKEYGNWGAF